MNNEYTKCFYNNLNKTDQIAEKITVLIRIYKFSWVLKSFNINIHVDFVFFCCYECKIALESEKLILLFRKLIRKS